MHVYLIVNCANGKIYVGQTSCPNLKRYFQKKLADGKYRTKKKIPLYNAIRKYGPKVFIIDSLWQPHTKQQMNMMEKRLIALLNSRDRNVGYNVTDGGDGLSGYKFSEEHKRKISFGLRGKKNALGVKRTAEHKKRISEAQKGNKHAAGRIQTDKWWAAQMLNSFAVKTPEEKKKLNAMANESRRNGKGWIVTEEQKQHLSEKLKGIPKSDETRARMRESFLARTTPEQRRAMSKLANETRWSNPD
jgi:group I intron endonuclease